MDQTAGAMDVGRSRRTVVASLGFAQILAWSSSYYLTAVLPLPVAADTGWPQGWTVGALSIGLLASGLVSPFVGRLIERRGGRPVLAGSALLIAAGLVMLALAPNLASFVVGWIVIGVGMGAGLYDAVFAALGRLYGDGARSAISNVTLFGGFASSVSWPLGGYLVEHVGWRDTCLVFAAVDALVLCPLYLIGFPREAAQHPLSGSADQPVERHAAVFVGRRKLMILLTICLTLASALMAVISVHLLTLLRLGGMEAAMVMALGTLLGPLQVGGRLLEISLGRNRHPAISMMVSTLLVAIGLALLFGNPGTVAVGIVVLGVGSGVRSIVRGTLPLILFGREGYAVLMGRLAVPTLLVQAAGPSAGAWLLDRFGVNEALGVLVALALLNFLSAALLPFRRPAGAR